MKQKGLICLIFVLLFSPLIPTVHAEALVENSKSAILIEASTGRILYELNKNERLEPASMTKMMPMYLVLEAVANGQLAWEDMVTVSEHAASLGGTQIFLEEGEQMSVRDLFLSVAISSANDSVTALGEAIAGSEEEFVKMMNERAQAFGMSNTHFENSTGLPAEGHLTTAYDMATLARRLLTRFPEVTEFTVLYEAYVREDSEEPFWLVNTNKLVRYLDGVDGLKTGYTKAAGFCLTATAYRDGMRVIAVVMGADQREDRNREVARLVEYAFARYELHPRIEVGQVVHIGGHHLAAGRQFDVVTTSPINLLVGVDQNVEEESKEIHLNQDLKFPIEAGTYIGILTYIVDGEVYMEVPLTVAETIEKTGLISLWGHLLGRLLFGS